MSMLQIKRAGRFTILSALVLLFAAIGACAEEAKLTQQVSPQAPVDVQPEPAADQEPVWIDVRSWAENKLDSIAGDPHIPHSEIVAGVTGQFPDKSTPIRLYCAAGGRAGKALDELIAAGYTDIENAGGIDAVRKIRFPAKAVEPAENDAAEAVKDEAASQPEQ